MAIKPLPSVRKPISGILLGLAIVGLLGVQVSPAEAQG